MLNKWSLKLSFYLLSLILLGFGNTIQAKFSNSLPEIKGSLNNIATKTFPTLEKGHSFSKLTSANSNLLPPPIYSKHYIAPAPWQYWSKANQIVITTESTALVSGTISKSDGALIASFKCKANVPFVMSFSGSPDALSTHPLNQIVSAAGLIVEANASISVNLRNIASDYNNSYDPFIKGNASLFSFGDAGIGTAFRVGYYRDGNLAGKDDQPIYSIMALDDNTEIKIAGVVKTTLNKGQSYLFKCPIGTLVESTRSAVMNTSARLDAPEGCGDGAYNPIPPIISLGTEYVIVRGEGNPTAEQTTVVATEANTNVTVQFFDDNGVQRDLRNFVIPQAGGFITFAHGYYNGTYNSVSNTGKYSSSRIVTTKNVVVFSGTAGASGGAGCEVDVATLVPIADCAGSRTVETAEFTDYSNGKLPYFGYILTKSPNEIFLTTQGGSTSYTSRDIETISGIANRKPLGSSGLFLIKFTDANIGSPKVITINSLSRLTVSMVQQSNKFSMSNFISRFAEKAAQPAVDLTDCTAAKLTADPLSDAPYQWYYNGVKIEGAVDNFYIATASGNYTVSSKLECGMSAQSMPLIVSVCSIDRAIEKSVDIPLPELNQVVNFTLKASNKSASIATGVLVRDLLPAGYAYVFSTASTGNYDAVTGEWLIGSMNPNSIETLTIKAKVIAVGAHTNTATITGTQRDNNVTNDESSARTTTVEGEVTLISIGSENRTVCVNKPIDDIIFKIEGGASGATISGLPAGLAVIPYDSGTKLIKITGTPSAATSPAGITYTIETIGGIRVTKTGVIIVKENVTEPVFSSSLVLKRCLGAGSDSYTATSSNSDGIVYSIFPESAGTIDSATGLVMWAADFTGVADITATALGCDEKKKKIFVNVYSRPAAPGTTHLKYCHNQIGVPVLTATGETNAIFTWYDASGNVIDGSIAPSTSAVGSTTYYVTQKIGVDGCESEKSPLEVIIKSVPAAPTATSATYCQNEVASVLTANGSNLIWYDLNGLLPQPPTPSTANVGVTEYYVTQVNTEGCEGPRTTITVTVKPTPPAPKASSVVYCQNEVASVLTANGSNLIWYDSNGLLPQAPTPSTANAGVTEYYVSQVNTEGCEGPRTTIKVSVKPIQEKLVITTSGPISFCVGGSVVLKSSNSSNYQWFKDNSIMIGEIEQTLIVAASGKYTVVSLNENGCKSVSSESTNVIVERIPARPTITAETPLEVCEGNTVQLSSSAPSGNIWYRNGVIIPGATNTTFNASLAGRYTLGVISAGGCVSQISDPIDVIINAPPKVPTISTQSSLVICKGSAALLVSSASSGNQWFKNGVVINGATSQNYLANAAGNYSVKTKNNSGCESLISNSISISVEAFELSLTASKTIAEFGSKVELKTNSNLKYKVLNWSPANLFNDAGAINQIFEFKNEIIVKVNAISENGCPASATIKITLDKKRDLFIPNTFTPNGDGKNDVVKVLGTGIETIDWSVYSQWGELVYKSKERDAAWDGSFRGVMQPVGVYVYKCVVRFTDGEEMVKHGSINLLR